jgi:hypothetical protein
MILTAGILAVLGSLCIVLGSFFQARLAYFQLTTTPPKPDALLRGLMYGIITAQGFLYGWVLVLAGGVLALAGAIVAIIAALS